MPGQPPTAPPPTPRLHFIDGLRGLAMLMVLAFHCALYGSPWYAPGALAAPVGYGHVGVNLFLVLSGFCLYWPFVKGGRRREPTLWEFARRRCRRILPPYYAALTFFWVFLFWDQRTHHHFHQDATSTSHVVKSLLWHLAMLHNLRPEYVVSINGPFWSLALESSLYVLFPLLVEGLRRLGPLRTVLLLLAVDLGYRLAAGALCPASALTGEEQFVIFYSLPGRCFEFGAGMLAALLLASRQDMALRLAGPVCVLTGLAAVAITERFGLYAAPCDVTWGVCFAGLILAASRPQSLLNKALSWPALVKLGVFSYSVYLIHQPLVKALCALATRHHLPSAGCAVLVIMPLMVAVGYVFHLLFEKPFMGPATPKVTRASVPSPAAIKNVKNAAPPAV